MKKGTNIFMHISAESNENVSARSIQVGSSSNCSIDQLSNK